jgi:steroid delta-isomerase
MQHTDVRACGDIYEAWDRLARAGDVEGLLALYAPDATLESPLVPRLLARADGTLRGPAELRPFFAAGTQRRPNELVRWQRSGEFLTDGRLLFWEYPREAPDGDQLDLAELMEIVDGRIQKHRIYWGWRGFALLNGG